jgi:pre-mRNA-splicing helicase BRR2
MAERSARSRQYEYRANSNLVLQPERTPLPAGEATGEVESLRGRINPRSFGELAVRERPPELEAIKAKRRKDQRQEPSAKRSASSLSGNLLGNADEWEGTSYRPKTKETRSAYQRMLELVELSLGDQPSDVTKSAAEEILAQLKDEHLRPAERRSNVEELLGKLNDERFAELIELSRKITDYSENAAALAAAEAATQQAAMEEETGVSVIFDEDEEQERDDEDDGRFGSQSDEESSDQDERENEQEQDARMDVGEENAEGIVRSRGLADSRQERDPLALDARQIDAFWLQRQIAKFVPEAEAAQAAANHVYRILETESDDRACENDLVQLLEYERFDLIKVLLRNRVAIVWCTRLAKAENDGERKQIDAYLQGNPETRALWEALHRTKSSADRTRELERSLETAARGRSESIGAARREARNAGASGLGGAARGGVTGAAVVEFGAYPPKRLIELNAIEFHQESHLMSNAECKLPPGSFVAKKKGYEEIHIPALKAPGFGQDEKLVQVKQRMPAWSHAAFEKVTQLNRVQSRVYESAFESGENILLCAPTGAGKTNVAMLTVMQQIGLYIDPVSGQLDRSAFKIVYIAPMKALVQEMVRSFSARLEAYGVVVKELSGDQNLTKQQIGETQIIVTTPEKWDIVTRKSGDRTYAELVRLMIVDEIHLLHDSRGPVLESIIARTIRQVEESQQMVRLVGLSATLPNYEDVGLLLRVEPRNVFYFDNSFRPVPLEQQFIGITEKKGLKRFQLMNDITYEKVMDHVGENQVLVFVHSRKETAKTARALRDMAMERDALGRFLSNPASRELLQVESEEVINPDLKELLPYGIAIHHAGLSREDRTLAEDLFAGGHVQCLVSTATLAWGVNLPAHCCIIKGTQIYSPEKGRWTELSPLDVMQMLGRAGRPAFDTQGMGIVITTHSELQFYLSLMNQQLPIESQMIARLPDMLNAEIVLGSVQNAREAVTWLNYTYLYICMLRNASLYGIPASEAESDPTLEQRKSDLVHSAATVLDRHNLIKYDRKTGQYQITDLGRVSSHYYVQYASMSTYNEHLKPGMSDIELFRVFSLSHEFKYIAVRVDEQLELEKLLERVPIPVKESIEESSAKVNVLLQAYISRLRLEGFALTADMVYVTQSASRLLRALYEIVLRRGWAQLAHRLLNLCKTVDRRAWATQSPLRQFKGIPEKAVRSLERNNFTMDRLYDLNSQELGDLVHNPGIGKSLHKYVHQFPRLELSAHVQPVTRSMLRVELTITPDFEYNELFHGNALAWWVIVEDVDAERILHYEYFLLKSKFAAEDHVLDFTVPVTDPIPPQYFVRVLSDRWLGAESLLAISFRHLMLPDKYPPHTELLDLQPLPVSALKSERAQALFGDFALFNAIQTQAFPALYNANESALVCAPTGSGKTVCAELAICRFLEESAGNTPAGQIVYIAPLAALAAERKRDWTARFGKLGLRVGELTGELLVDLRRLEESHITIALPEQWDLLSRRWKQRKQVQAVRLFIVDELHMISAEHGHILEVIVSRMRYIAMQTETKIRFVGLATSLANGKDVGEWIGCTPQTLFNFHPTVRPIALQVHMQGFENPHFASQMLSMTKPTLHAVRHHADGKPVIIYVTSRKETRRVARELMLYCEASGTPRAFLRIESERLAAIADPVIGPLDEQLQGNSYTSNAALRKALEYGIGFLHEALSLRERQLVESLYAEQAIQVVLCTNTLCWGTSLNAPLVIIMGTQYYDGKEHRYVDYPITDVLQMMGHAGRAGIDDGAKCIILCNAPRKEYYKKFLHEPLPLESQLDHYLHDHLNAEIVTNTIQNKQDAVDYLTWTFLYRRLSQNPNYYNMQGRTHRHLSDYLSELIENTIEDLANSKCIVVEEDEMTLTPLNLGIITAYYYAKYTTVELFNSNLNDATKMKALIEILAAAYEWEVIPIRFREAGLLKKLAAHLPMKIDAPNFNRIATKINILMQAHFSRVQLASDLKSDQAFILDRAVNLLQAIVDVISSSGWLAPALAAMDLSQMLVQAVWDNESDLRQLPHFSAALVQRCHDRNVTSVYELMELEDSQRSDLLSSLNPRQIADVARACNRYPNIGVQLEFEAAGIEQQPQPAEDAPLQAVALTGHPVQVKVRLSRPEQHVDSVYAPFFPKPKAEGWWLAIGDASRNKLLRIKRITMNKSTFATVLDFVAPEPGEHNLTLSFISDSYRGCDQEYEIALQVNEN